MNYFKLFMGKILILSFSAFLHLFLLISILSINTEDLSSNSTGIDRTYCIDLNLNNIECEPGTGFSSGQYSCCNYESVKEDFNDCFMIDDEINETKQEIAEILTEIQNKSEIEGRKITEKFLKTTEEIIKICESEIFLQLKKEKRKQSKHRKKRIKISKRKNKDKRNLRKKTILKTKTDVSGDGSSGKFKWGSGSGNSLFVNSFSNSKGSDLKLISSIIIRSLKRNLIYPVSARKMGRYGKVNLSFFLEKTGEINKKIRITKSSGCRELDEAVKKALEKSSPVRLPGKLIGRISFRLPVVFKLK